jgi:hypothetical protein
MIKNVIIEAVIIFYSFILGITAIAPMNRNKIHTVQIIVFLYVIGFKK